MSTNEQQIIEAIEAYGYNKLAIAKAIGVSPSTVTRMAQGKFTASTTNNRGMAVSSTLLKKLENFLAYAKTSPRKSRHELILPTEKPKEPVPVPGVTYIPVAVNTWLDNGPDLMTPEQEAKLPANQRAIREIKTGRYTEVFNPRTNSREIIPYCSTAAYNLGLARHEPPIYEHDPDKQYREKWDRYPIPVRAKIQARANLLASWKERGMNRRLTRHEQLAIIKEVMDLLEFSSTLTPDGYNPSQQLDTLQYPLKRVDHSNVW